MALLFASASTQRIEVASSPNPVYPFTMAFWYRPTTVNVQFRQFYISGGSNQHAGLGHASSGAIFAERRNTTAVQASGGLLTANSWWHVAGVFLNATSCTAYRNGVAGTVNTTSVTMPTTTVTTLGALNNNGTVVSHTNGAMAEAAIWNVDLDQAELTALAKGFPPFLIRPSALIFYAPLKSDASPSQELRGGQSLTWVGTPTLFPHGTLFGQAGKLWIPPFTAPPPVAVAGTIAATSTLTGALTVTAAGAGTIAAASSLTGELTTIASPLAGTIAATSALTGAATVTGVNALVGTITATSALTATMTVEGVKALGGTVASTVTLSGSLTASVDLAGSFAASSGLVGELELAFPLAGTITVVSAVTGRLDNIRNPQPRFAVHWFWERCNHSEHPGPPATCPGCGAVVVEMTDDLEVFCRHYTEGMVDADGATVTVDCPYVATVDDSNYAQPLAADVAAGYVLTEPVP